MTDILAEALADVDNENNKRILTSLASSPPSSQKEIALNYAKSAVETLALIMANTELAAGARVSAAREILDRAFGKPIQQVETNNKLDADMMAILEGQFYHKLESARERQRSVLKERGIID